MYIDTATANSRSARPQIIISPSRNDGSSPLVENFIGQHADAPPSYLEATTPGLYTSRQSGEEGARLLSFDGREPRDAALKEDQYAQQSLWKRCTRSPWFRLFAAVITLLLIILMMALMAAAVSIRRDQQDAAAATRPSAQPAEAEPTLSGTGVFHGDDDTEGPQIITVPWPSSVAQPNANQPTPVASPQPSHSGATQSQDDDEESTKPDLIAIPWPSHSAAAQPPASADTAQTFPIRWPSKCGKGYNVKTEWYDFGKPSDLHIQEAVHQLDGSYKRVAGWVHIAPAPANQAPGSVKVKMSYAISSTVNIDSVKYSRTPSGLVIGDPSFPDGFDGVRSGKACLGMSVTIYVAPGATMKTLKVSSNHMGMQIHHGSNFTVTDSTTISLTTGTLDAITFDSRQTYLKTISGSISGKFALRDLLSIVTKSGSVNIDIQPQEALPGSNNPAVFMADSLSGSIRTDFKRKRIPERDYQTYINTTVGSVGGSFIHGSRTEMNSIAGLITADILPFKSGNYQSEIYTQTHSGQTELVLHSPYKAKNMPMSGLVSTHKSTSGGLDVTYPTEWTGHIDGTSLSGALHLQGKELELLNENDNPGQNHVEAKKGNGESSLSFDTVSGECEIKVGRV